MTWKIIAIVFLVLFILTLVALKIIWYLLKKKSPQKSRDLAQKAAKKERQKILGEGYKTLKEKEKLLNQQNDDLRSFLNQELATLDYQRKTLEKLKSELMTKENELNEQTLELNEQTRLLESKKTNLITDLSSIATLTASEAEAKLFKEIKEQKSQEISRYLRQKELETTKKAHEMSVNILINALEKFKTDFVQLRTTSTIKIPDEQMKGRIIGKDGRNIKTFEQYAGVDVIIDDTPDLIMISSFNPIRREIAIKTLEKLISDGRIQPVRIENELIAQTQKLDELIYQTGCEVTEELGIYDMDLQLVKLVGKLKYRTSYSQNVLLHSIEVAKISGAIAAELGLDERVAIRSGLLHDIGKALDFEQEGNHVELGVEVARKYGENEVVVNTIAAHHEDVAKTSMTAAIVAIADALSATRPGARNEQLEDFVQRITEIEEICNNIPGVVKSYALQSGRQVRVLVDPVKVDDYHMMELIDQISTRLKEVSIPGNITLTLIREHRETVVIK
ncbi:Ribonuclease Y [Mesoplasma sp. JKS002657]|uniref:ribonuclease Y n=1 Tax=Mesoplasma whartonense TaxID=2878854 RepID=UPI002022A1D6|nr:ribonuclease Y [Mesoplasma sp. JKS002657]MCL8212616.1 Ribonuclease Y [Mesoplasma sp. JKS002661]MCL8216226.1 Ribonuclease Y [Mesoplasma sp. JKS002657]